MNFDDWDKEQKEKVIATLVELVVERSREKYQTGVSYFDADEIITSLFNKE